MRRPKQPLFLVRAVYRKRRLRDAARMLPIFGFVLLMPVLWNVSARGWIYVFSVWLGLILAAGFLARRLGQDVEEMRRDAPDEVGTNPFGGDDAL
jgi:hypothetical protein